MRWMIRRSRNVHIDGTEEEYIHLVNYALKSPKEVEQLGHELVQAALEWRAEIEKRGPPGPPPYKTFDFNSHSGGGPKKIASWVEHPWALVRDGGGTSIAFLVEEVKEENRHFKAWIVKFENGEHRWKCKSEGTSRIETRDLIQTFPYTLPDSPPLGEIKLARKEALASRAAP
jgi:hypothetical protein